MVVETNHEIGNNDKEHFKNELTACITNKMIHELVAYIWFYLNFTEPLKIKQEHIDLIKTPSYKNNDRKENIEPPIITFKRSILIALIIGRMIIAIILIIIIIIIMIIIIIIIMIIIIII